MLYARLYRWFMAFAHRHNWHHAPPIYPDGDTQLWCTWCGFRQTVKLRVRTPGDELLKNLGPYQAVTNALDGAQEK